MSKKESKQSRQSEYLSALVQSNGSKSVAGKITGIPRQTYHRWFKDDEDFKNRCDEIFPKIERELLEECIKRAKEKSDVLMIFTLKALNPTRYDDNIRKLKIAQPESQSAQEYTGNTTQLVEELLLADPLIDYSILIESAQNIAKKQASD